jgi:hypothetical protein
MKTKGHSIILLLGVALLISTAISSSYGTTVSPERPQWHVGDWWMFSIKISGEVNLNGIYTFTVVNDEVDVFQNEQNFNCYQLDASGEGTLSGEVGDNEIEGTWTINEKHYYMKSDQSWVAINSTYQKTFTVKDNDSGAIQISLVQDEKFTSTTIIATSYNPPFEANKGFPLTVGESWSAETTETTTTQTAVNFNLESTTETETYTNKFSVLRKESITLPMGETETYVVKMTEPDGAYSETYYSPEVGFDVKQIDYDSAEAVEATLELLDYSYSTTGDSEQQLFSVEILQTFIILAIVATAVIAAIFLLKRRRTDRQSQIDDN